MRVFLCLALCLWLALPALADGKGPVLFLPALPGSTTTGDGRCGDLLEQAGLKPDGLEYLYCRPAADPRTGRAVLAARYRVPGARAAAVETALRERTGMAALQRQAGIWQLPEDGAGHFRLRPAGTDRPDRPGALSPGLSADMLMDVPAGPSAGLLPDPAADLDVDVPTGLVPDVPAGLLPGPAAGGPADGKRADSKPPLPVAEGDAARDAITAPPVPAPDRSTGTTAGQAGVGAAAQASGAALTAGAPAPLPRGAGPQDGSRGPLQSGPRETPRNAPQTGPLCTLVMGEVPQQGAFAPRREDWGKIAWFAVTVRLERE